jgi:AraC-like DNA-binding protein
MRLLSDPAGAEKTVLEILYEVGFNSKSVFNYQFKKVTGVTPQEYRSKMSGDSPKEQISGSRRFAI